MIVAFSGYARSGKDTAAAFLQEEYGYTPIAFADKVRQALLALNPIVGIDQSDYHSRVPEKMYLDSVIEKHGWNGYKSSEYGDEIRRLLQRLGTEVGRNILGQDIWVDAALNGVGPEDNVCITDCRFPNEFDAIRSRNGKVIRITRPGVGPANNHPSETSLDQAPFDGYILNDGTLEQFRNTVLGLIW